MAIFQPKLLNRINLYYMVTIVTLCSMSYILGSYRHSPIKDAAAAAAAQFPKTAKSSPCAALTEISNRLKSTILDFAAHHAADSEIGRNLTAASSRTTRTERCDPRYSEYVPCEDPKRSVRFPRARLTFRERHCPEESELLRCRIPAPHGYVAPFKWPKSRDMVWYANVPHKWLTIEKASQNWVRFEGDRFTFPGGGTMFPRGAGSYIDDIGRLINLKDGSVRTAIDTGCGVASWGAYLLSRDILAMSFAPVDTHDAQVQFALERGVPAIIGVMATNRLPYPSRAFDMAHCSRCLIPWGSYDGLYLTEVDRILRPGGYWVLSGPPINGKAHARGWNRTEQDLNAEQNEIEAVAKSLCWKKLNQKGDIAVWQKPTNHVHCRKIHRVLPTTTPQFCPPDQNPDAAWYTKMESCLTPLPEVSGIKQVAGGEVSKWPQRLTDVPPRISSGSVDGVTGEDFTQDTDRWKKRVSYYKNLNPEFGQKGRYRNLLDMNAYLGGFAAALVHDPVWVMNVVPGEAKVNTLGVVYERGLIGTYQNWCEAMSTYPRTYDFIHADSVFSLYAGRCEMVDMLLEMDRILRPEGCVIFADDVDTIVKIKKHTDGMEWNSFIHDSDRGPHDREKILVAVKKYWTASSPAPDLRES